MAASSHPYYRLHTRILSVVILCAFAYLYIGSTVYVHTHWVDGKKVAHSHPYSATHQHGNSHQVFTYMQMGAALTTPPVAFVLTVTLLVVKMHWEVMPNASSLTVALNRLVPRAPPVFFFE